MYFNAQRARIPGLGTTSHGWVSTFPLSQNAGRVTTAGSQLFRCLKTRGGSPYADIIVNMQFFVGCNVPLRQWRLNLGRNPTVIFTPTQTSSLYFTFSEKADGHQLVGGKVVEMTANFETAQAS